MFALREAARRHPVSWYVLVTFVISYAMGIPLALRAQGLITADVPVWLHYLYSFGPIAGAFIVTALVAGAGGIRDLLSRMVRWNIGARWLLVAIASPFALYVLGAVVMRGIEGRWPDVTLLGDVNYLGNIGFWVVPLWVITYGYGEETGWRGFVLPRLQERHSALAASLLIATVWMLWHVPAFLYLPSYTGMDPLVIPMFFFGVACGSVLFTWIYNGTGGSIFAVAMWHAFWDLVSASTGSAGTLAAVMTTIIVVWAFAIVFVGGAATLTRGRKAVLTVA